MNARLRSSWLALRSFLGWCLLGRLCKQCKKERTDHHIMDLPCGDCSANNWREYYANLDRRAREARIEELVEAIRRSGCTGTRP